MRALIAIFNQIDGNGRVKVANDKEYIENLFQPLEKTAALITNGLDNVSPNIEQRERDVRFNTINLMNVCGKIENIEIIETNKNGYGDLPIYEVYGDIVAFDNPSGEHFGKLFDQNLIKVCMRSIARHIIDKDKDLRLIYDHKIICWDMCKK